MNKKSILFIILILSGLNVVYGQETLTMDKCVELALSNSEMVRIAEMNLLAAQGMKQDAFGGFLPKLNVSASYTRLSEVPALSMAAPTYTPVMVTDLITGLPVNGMIITGSEDFEYKMGEQDNYSAKLTLTQPLFTWGKIYQGYKISQFSYQLAEENYRKTKNELIFNVKKSFYSVLLMREFVNIAQNAVKLMERHYEVIQAFYNEGKVSSVDVSRVKVQMVNSKTRLIRAESGLKLAKKALLNIINYPEAQDWEISGELLFSGDRDILPLEDYINSAIESRPEMKQTKIQQNIGKSLVKITRAENRPNIAFIGNYEYSRPFYFDDEWGDSWNVTCALTYPFFNGFSDRGKRKQAKAKLEQIKSGGNLLREGIKLEVEKAYLDKKDAMERIEAQKENVRTAKENLEAIQKRYERGLVSDLDLRETRLALNQAEVEYSQALFDYNVALAELEKAIGK